MSCEEKCNIQSLVFRDSEFFTQRLEILNKGKNFVEFAPAKKKRGVEVDGNGKRAVPWPQAKSSLTNTTLLTPHPIAKKECLPHHGNMSLNFHK